MKWTKKYLNIKYYFKSFFFSFVNNTLTQIPFNGTNFINARLTQRIFSVWSVVGEMEINSVANLATVQTPLATFSLQKSAQTLFSLRESPVLPLS